MTRAVAGLPDGVFAASNAHVAGEVRLCNIPGHCLTRVFQVSATDRAGRVVAHTITSGTGNRYRLLVPAGRYSLLAHSHGLRCTGSVTAVANRTVVKNIICLVP